MIVKEINYSIVVNSAKSPGGYGARWQEIHEFASDYVVWTVDVWPNRMAFISFSPSGGGLSTRIELPCNWTFVHTN